MEKGEILFHYNRDERLKKASPEVKWLVEKQKKGKLSITKNLISNKPFVLIFITILLAIISANIYEIIKDINPGVRLADNYFSAKAFRFKGKLYVTITAEIKNELKTGTMIEVWAKSDNIDIPVISDVLPEKGKEDYYFEITEGSRRIEVLKLGILVNEEKAELEVIISDN